ncbi:S8 family serine peptidase [Kibdelosporangium philippinense]|uniref:S8 family serine peptidase n=1 Tax=Kibdelosporangium philippinense TaxID=211113 RepID=A0ABS8Z1P7_9PSEU|nr:S8 family serine peptidase [Kibdelosporangium philippinense]MCE7001861.1 S8 family serine peptidase [Kibdelosporangium philippinense]
MRIHALVTAGLIAGLLPALPTEAVAAPEQPKTLTLVTGDRIAVQGKDVQPLPTPGRAGVVFHSYELAGHKYVVPMDAAEPIAAGRLDRRLFDVTSLLEFGYADTADLPVIVEGQRMQAKRVPKGQAWQELKTSQDKVWLDGKRKLSLKESVPQIGTPAAWQAGFTGKGVTVAVLDTGIDATHPDFKGRIADAKDFTTDQNPDDTFGHGTHVASTIAGEGKYRGVAPEATLVVGKVCLPTGCPDSAILEAMEWAAKEKKAQIINMSLGGQNGPDVDPLEAAVDRLTAETGALFVIAAGNQAYRPESVSSPSTADAALSVGAVSKQNAIEAYSNEGPRAGDGAIKPEVAAPGTNIVAARATNSGLPPVDEIYTMASGTSMATPHVAGVAALLLQQRPTLKAAELKSLLIGSSTGEGAVYSVGSGRVDVARAIKQDLTATNSVNFGAQPHNSSEPIRKTVTYQNSGTAPKTLSLSTTESVFSVEPKEITVPAGGTAEVTVVAQTTTAGHVSGRLVATAGEARVITPMTVNKETESYNLTITQIGRDGKPAPIEAMSVVNTYTMAADFPNNESGTVTLRRPKGKYMVDAVIMTDTEISHVPYLSLDLDRDTQITLDARAAKLVRPSVRGVQGELALQDVGYYRYFDSQHGRIALGSGIQQFGFGEKVTPFYTTQFGPAVPKEDLEAWVNVKVADPMKDISYINSPYVYHMFWGMRGTYPTGFAPETKQREYAAVKQNYARMTPGKYGYTWSFGSSPEVDRRSAVPLQMTLPFSRTEYYLADGPQWYQSFHQGTEPLSFPDVSNVEEKSKQKLVAGQTTVKNWNKGVFGPSFAPEGSPLNYSSVRVGDTMWIHAPGYSDGTPGRMGYPMKSKSSKIALYRDGKLVSERDSLFSNRFDALPQQQTTYRAEVTLELQPDFLPLSSKTHTAWTFKSATVEKAQLPLFTARISPNLDMTNTAKANCLLMLPIKFEHNPGSVASPVKSVTLEASFDGKNWHKVPVIHAGDTWYGLEMNNTKAKFASLRLTATDKAGTKVEQTFTNAYRIG